MHFIAKVMVSQTYRKISRHELGVTLNEFVSLDNVLHPTDGKTNPTRWETIITQL